MAGTVRMGGGETKVAVRMEVTATVVAPTADMEIETEMARMAVTETEMARTAVLIMEMGRMAGTQATAVVHTEVIPTVPHRMTPIWGNTVLSTEAITTKTESIRIALLPKLLSILKTGRMVS